MTGVSGRGSGFLPASSLYVIFLPDSVFPPGIRFFHNPIAVLGIVILLIEENNPGLLEMLFFMLRVGTTASCR